MKNVCEEIRSLFDPYLNGGLSKEDRERMDGHLETCDACRSELALERRIVDALTPTSPASIIAPIREEFFICNLSEILKPSSW